MDEQLLPRGRMQDDVLALKSTFDTSCWRIWGLSPWALFAKTKECRVVEVLVMSK